VKLLLSKLRDACCHHIAPFEGLWGYTQSLDDYPGTIFRFPLRTATTRSSLRTSKSYLDSVEVNRLMETYFNEARISLLFLRRIKSIDFSIHGKAASGWSVTRQTSLDEDAKSFSELVICQFANNMDFGAQVNGEDKWWVAIEDLRPTAYRLPKSSRRVIKNVECGIAALVSSTVESHDSNITPPKALQSRMFNTLPLPISSDLPVHIHATFYLSGDRQSIAIDEHDTQSHGSGWNRYLLQDALPRLYLSFLGDIQPQVRQDVFNFWPQQEPPRRSSSELLCASFWKELPKSSQQLFPKAQPRRSCSELLCASFQKKLPKSSQRLFPKAQPTTEVSHRHPTQRFDINQAVFDFLPKFPSETLAPLLMSLDVNLVCEVPSEVGKHLKEIPGVKTVTASMLRSLFKSDKSRMCLSAEMNKNPRVLEVLLRQLLSSNTDLKDLDGCHILPLADGNLATLKLVESNDVQSSMCYVASETELSLFEFASRHLVPASIGTKFQVVLESGKFNLTCLRLCHVKFLLKLMPVVSTPYPEGDKWLSEFWSYWNGNIDSCLPSSNLDSIESKVFRARVGEVDTYFAPFTFHHLPAVVDPSVAEQQRLCSKFPGLYRCNTGFMPKILNDDEKSLHKENSFYRLIRGLGSLASSAGIGIGAFVEANLDPTHMEVISPTQPTFLPSILLPIWNRY
jgi:sacsin